VDNINCSLQRYRGLTRSPSLGLQPTRSSSRHIVNGKEVGSQEGRDAWKRMDDRMAAFREGMNDPNSRTSFRTLTSTSRRTKYDNQDTEEEFTVGDGKNSRVADKNEIGKIFGNMRLSDFGLFGNRAQPPIYNEHPMMGADPDDTGGAYLEPITSEEAQKLQQQQAPQPESHDPSQLQVVPYGYDFRQEAAAAPAARLPPQPRQQPYSPQSPPLRTYPRERATSLESGLRPSQRQATTSSCGTETVNVPDKRIKDDRENILKFINACRKAHGVPDVTMDPPMNDVSQKHTNKNALACTPNAHSHNPKYGENLAWMANSDMRSLNPVLGALHWYNEVKLVKFQNGRYPHSGSTPGAGHFTAMVWKNARKVGIGIRYMKKGNSMYQVYVTVNFSPASNVMPYFRENVLPATDSGWLQAPESEYKDLLLQTRRPF